MSSRALRDYVDLQRGNTYKSALLGLPGPKLLGLGSIQRNGGFKGDNLKSYGGESDAKILLRPGDVYASLKDVTQSADLLGAVARVPHEVEQGRLTQDTVKLAFKDGAPISLIYWVLRSPEYRGFCRSFATGTTNLGLPREDFLAYPIPNPTPARLHLVAVLDALDDKIELNRRMNETLEAMAREIFKDWFVDFGPTRAKMAMRGEDPQKENVARTPYLAPDIWSLFPDRLDDAGKPEGWALGSMSDLLLLQRGFDLPSQDRIDGPHPIVAASGPNGSHNAFMVKGPGVTTGRSGVLGNVFFVHEDFWPLNTSLWVKEFRRATPSYTYFYLQNVDFGSYNAGSAVPTLNRNHIHGLPTVLPPHALIKAFDELALPLLKRQECSRLESGTLSATRDFLLPKLMSGEVRVGDAVAHI